MGGFHPQQPGTDLPVDVFAVLWRDGAGGAQAKAALAVLAPLVRLDVSGAFHDRIFLWPGAAAPGDLVVHVGRTAAAETTALDPNASALDAFPGDLAAGWAVPVFLPKVIRV